MNITPVWCEASFGRQLLDIEADLHSHPELSWEETRTTQKIVEILRGLPGIELIDTGAKTGAVARLAGGPGPAIALRADIDAIPQHEEVRRPDVSLYDGKMHGCGHDIHTTSLLGAAMALCQRRSDLRGDVYFIFQPAEELLTGAEYLVEKCGLFQKIHPAAIFGLHNYPELPVGTAGVKLGQLMSYKDVFELRFVGRSGHSSTPQKNIDPIVAAAAFIQAVQTIVSRNVGPLDQAVVSIYQVHAGSPGSMVVEDALVTGNIRTLDETVRQRVLQRFEQIAKGTAETYECQLQLDLHPIVPGVNNSPEMYQIARAAAAASLGEPAVETPPVNLASEDFSIYSRYAPSFFYFLGSGTPGREVYLWHSAHFHGDERAPIYGAALLAQSVLTAQAML